MRDRWGNEGMAPYNKRGDRPRASGKIELNFPFKISPLQRQCSTVYY